MAAASVYDHRGSPSSLLPLQEAHQDQQVGQTQNPFKLLSLHWVSECVRFCMCFIRVESLLPTVLWFSCRQVPLAFKARHSEGLASWLQDPQSGELNVDLEPLTFWGRISTIVIIFLFVGHLHGCVNLDYTTSLLLLPISLWFLLYIVKCGKSFKLVFRSFSSIVTL